MNYESMLEIQSTIAPGIVFQIQRMSFGRRVELTKLVRDLIHRIEFLQAGEDLKGRLDAALLLGEVEKLYLQWGLKAICGLYIDGREASVEDVTMTGPEDLCREIVSAIKRECGLTEAERKN